MFSHQADAVLATIRAEIQQHGQSIVGCDQLLVFVLRNAPIRSQFAHIFAMAEKEGWSLEFKPDGMVRFADLQSAAGKSGAWEGLNRDIVRNSEDLPARHTRVF